MYNNGCSDDEDTALINWLKSKWDVKPKPLSEWTEEDLEDYDVMVCSDALNGGCNIQKGSPAYNKHMDGLGLVEIPDYSYVRAGYKFGYVTWYTGSTEYPSENIEITKTDTITGYPQTISIFKEPERMSFLLDSRLKSVAVDLADPNIANDKSTLFKVDEDGHGRYAYVGWFYEATPSDLNSNGERILQRTINWVQCANANGCSVA